MMFRKGRLSRNSSWSSDDSRGALGSLSRASSFAEEPQSGNKPLEPPVLVYHSCARSIVFRDSLRRASIERSDSALSTGSTLTESNFHSHTTTKQTTVTSSTGTTKTAVERKDSTADDNLPGIDLPTIVKATHFQPRIVPLPPLELGPKEEFQPLLRTEDAMEQGSWTRAEHEVVERFRNQTAVVKTIKNTEWTQFLERFWNCQAATRGRSPQHQDAMMSDDEDPYTQFNSFVTSTSLLPHSGRKMRCFGSTTQYTVGVVFGLPTNWESSAAEDSVVEETETWAWPAGYAAKTEFNVDGHGKLINGRKEALAPLSVMRQYNDDYLHKKEYMVACRLTAGLPYVPYNEVYVRVGGKGRIVEGADVASGKDCHPSYETGVGLPIALFVRTATYENLISLMRARARLLHVLGEEHIKGIPLLLITPEQGVRVFTAQLQGQFWKIASQSLNPFQNAQISHKTTGINADETFIQQKMNELIDLDESIQERLTPEELARLAGGFGATDESVAAILTSCHDADKKLNDSTSAGESGEKSNESHKLQDVVNEGLVYSVRAGDYHTSRQLLILYSVVAARVSDIGDGGGGDDANVESSSIGETSNKIERQLIRSPDLSKGALMDLSAASFAAPPPPPLDTARLRSATNSDGLLAVLGAAQVLKCMKDGGAKRRVQEVISALEEWIEYGQHSAAFRVASWQKQRAAQGDLKIAMESHSNFMAFAGKKAITNRKTFAQRLRDATEATDFSDARFLLALHQIISTMHSPCLRLELLQYVLELDNRYSVAHVGRSVELAATCLSMASSTRAEDN